MPKNSNNSTKIQVLITEQGHVISKKAIDQPLTNIEKEQLNAVYHQTLANLACSIQSLTHLETALTLLIPEAKEEEDEFRNRIQNVKQLLVNKNADPNIINTLKMLKRHFYIDFTNHFITYILEQINFIQDNLLLIHKGLLGNLDFSFKLSIQELNHNEYEQYVGDTYVLIRKEGQYSISYYEDNKKIKDIPLSALSTSIQQKIAALKPDENAITLEKFMKSFTMVRELSLYHAKNAELKFGKVYISNLSHKKQNKKVSGYVSKKLSCQFTGDIYFDYRLLQRDKRRAMRTLIHEASHRFVLTADHGYYHSTQPLKHSPQLVRPILTELHSDKIKKDKTMLATNNADSHSYFVCDLTGTHFYTKVKNLQLLPKNDVNPSNGAIDKLTLFSKKNEEKIHDENKENTIKIETGI